MPFRAFNGILQALSLVAAAITVAIASAETGGCFDPATSPFDSADWSYCQKIPSDEHEIYLYYTPLEDEVLIGFHALHGTDGWTALGINGNGGMKGATFIVVREEDGEWIAEDRYAMDYVMPALDQQQDVKLLFAQQDNGQTAWGVAIPQNSCDSDGNDYEILDVSTSMLWAAGSSHTFGYHAARGQFQANLMQAPKEFKSTELPYVEFLMPNVTVEIGEGGSDPTNPYICSYFDLDVIPSSKGLFAEDIMFSHTVHVTRFSAVIAPESKPYVHHILLYACDGELDGEKQHLTVVPECSSMPEGCYEIKWPWAVGSDDIVFPDDVGLPIGGGASKRFLILQMHYYNPNLEEGIIDNSGVRAYYTTDLKEQEAGVMEFAAAVDSWQRPGLSTGQGRVSISFTTPSNCTLNAWSEPLNILYVGYHMHTYGTYMQVSVVRDGMNLGNLHYQSHYDFKHQSVAEPAPALRQLLPGDQITQTCVYNTSSAPGDVVEFGENTQNEMCYTLLYYYPRQPYADTFGYMGPWFNSSYCLEPATSEGFQDANLSLCAQILYENVPEFYQFENQVEITFDMLTACNGGEAFQDLFSSLPYLCPDCRANATCSSEEVMLQAQKVCTKECDNVGLSVYPDLNRTEAYTGNWGCSPSYYDEPSVPEAPACQARGASTIDTIKVNGITFLDIPAADADSDNSAGRKMSFAESCFLGGTLVLSFMFM